MDFIVLFRSLPCIVPQTSLNWIVNAACRLLVSTVPPASGRERDQAAPLPAATRRDHCTQGWGRGWCGFLGGGSGESPPSCSGWRSVTKLGWDDEFFPCTPSPSGQLESKSAWLHMPVPRITSCTSMGGRAGGAVGHSAGTLWHCRACSVLQRNARITDLQQMCLNNLFIKGT